MPYFDIVDGTGNTTSRIKAESQATADALCPEGATAVELTSDTREARRAREKYESLVKGEGVRRLRALVAQYSDAERETWPPQVREAEAVLADPAASAPLLGPLAQVRGITIAEMAQRVLTKADAFAGASGAILAAQKALLATSSPPENPTSDEHWPEAP